MTACRLAVCWMWNIFWNVHGCRRKVLERSLKVLESLNSKVTEEGVPCIITHAIFSVILRRVGRCLWLNVSQLQSRCELFCRIILYYCCGMLIRQALTDGFHFPDDILRSLHSFPLEFVSRLRRPTSQCSTVLESPVELGHDNHHDVDGAVDDLLPESSTGNKECNTTDDRSATHDVPMEDCSVPANCASNNESVDMSDCNKVSLLSHFICWW